MVSDKSDGQTIFWLASPSPGRVLRALERLRQVRPDLPSEWLLSCPYPPQGLRLLRASLTKEEVHAVGAYLSRSLMVPVTALQTASGGGAWVRWEQGAEGGRGQLTASAPLQWWQKLPGLPPPAPAWQVWAQGEGLPLVKVGHVPPLPYRTIASLERRDLLVERTGTWYALTLGAAI